MCPIKGCLWANMHRSSLPSSAKDAPLLIPSNAFVFRPEGTLVAIVTPENKIHWQKIEVGRDFGTSDGSPPRPQ